MIKKDRKKLFFILNLILGLLVISPILYALSISFMQPSEILQYPPKLLPKSLYLGNYKSVIHNVPILKFIFNSFFVSLIVTIGQVITASLAAYAFAFYNFKGKNVLFVAILATMMIPGEAIIIANYLTIGSLGLLDTYTGLIVPSLTSAMAVFMMRQYFLTVPKELKEASIIDGCSSFRFFIQILLPISKPVISSLSIYVFLSTWNQYMWPLLVTNRPSMRTVQIGISMLQFAETESVGVIMAGIVMILLPSILIFIIGQKHLVEGMTSGAVKG